MKRKNLLIAAIMYFVMAAIVAVFLVAINGCFVYTYPYPHEVSYPMEMEGDYYGDDYVDDYVDVSYAPVYGLGIYFRLGPSYPYYYYYGGYRYWYGSGYSYRYYRVWYDGGYPYYYYGGNYAPIHETNYYHYDVTVNNWYSAPLPSDSSAYGTPPKKHYKAYPPNKKRSHPSGKAIPKTTIPPKYDHKAFPPDRVGSGPGVPQPPKVNQSMVSATPGTSLPVKATPKPSAYHPPVKTAPKISSVSPYKHGSKTPKPNMAKPSIRKPTYVSPKSPYRKSVKPTVKASPSVHKSAQIHQKSPYLKTGSKKSSTALKHQPIHKSIHKKGK